MNTSPATGNDTPLLKAKGLSVHAGERLLCDQLDLTLLPEQCLVLLGPNGAGKTTLLHTLAGLHPLSAGSLHLSGRPYDELSGREIALIRGLLPQQQLDLFSTTVIESVLTGRHPHIGRWGWESDDDRALAREALAALDLAEMENRDVLTLSGGERQRVAIAMLLTQSPQLFLLDEPLNHLDLHYQIVALSLFRKLADAGKGIAMVMHDINLAARYADQIVLFNGRGSVVAGPTHDILQPELLSRAFDHPLHRHEIDGQVIFLPQSE